MIKKLQILLLITSFMMMACTGGRNNVRENTPADNKSASITNVQLGVGYIKRGMFDIAEEKLNKAIEHDPTNVDAYTTMAFLMMQMKKMDEAENYYLEALDIKENNPQTHNSYGTYLCRVGRLDEAMEEFKIAFTNPFYDTPYLAYSNAGTCLMNVRNYDMAEKFLRKALGKQPKLADALLSMAEIGIKTKRYLMARAYAQRFHAVNKPTAESLWVQVQAEKYLGATDHYLKYAKQLLTEFPDSQQAVWVEKLARDDRIRKN
jgi:type IV pilus assembly protein PilF